MPCAEAAVALANDRKCILEQRDPHTVELPPFNTRSRDSRKDSFLGNDADWVRTVHRQGRRVGSRAGDRGGHRQQPRDRVGARRSIRRIGHVIWGRGSIERRLDDGCVGFAGSAASGRPKATTSDPVRAMTSDDADRRAMTRTPTRRRGRRGPRETDEGDTDQDEDESTDDGDESSESTDARGRPMRRSKTRTTHRTREVDTTTTP